MMLLVLIVSLRGVPIPPHVGLLRLANEPSGVDNADLELASLRLGPRCAAVVLLCCREPVALEHKHTECPRDGMQ